MDYAEIVAALDAEIERLERARDFLASSLLLSKKPTTRTNKPKKRVRQKKSEPILLLQSEQIVPPIQRIPYKEKGRRTRNSSRLFAASPMSALSSHISATPVVVSASEAHQARVREIEQTRSSMQTALTVEQKSSGRSLGALIRAFNA